MNNSDFRNALEDSPETLGNVNMYNSSCTFRETSEAAVSYPFTIVTFTLEAYFELAICLY